MHKKYIFFGIALVFIICLMGFYAIQRQQEKEIDTLIDKLKSENSYLRKSAIDEIPKYKNRAVRPLIKLLLETQNESIRKDAIESLGYIKSAEAASALIHFFQQTHKMPNEVTSSLVNIGKPAIEILLNAYDKSDSYTKETILITLFHLTHKLFDDEKNLNKIKKLFLKGFLHEELTYLRKTALTFLGYSQFKDDPKVKSVIKNALKDENNDIRKTAFMVLLDRGAKLYFDRKEIDSIMEIVSGVERYYGLHKRFPASLIILAEVNIIKKEEILNPWGYPYIYKVAVDGKSIELISVGKDGIRNTDDDTVIIWK